MRHLELRAGSHVHGGTRRHIGAFTRARPRRFSESRRLKSGETSGDCDGGAADGSDGRVVRYWHGFFLLGWWRVAIRGSRELTLGGIKSAADGPRVFHRGRRVAEQRTLPRPVRGYRVAIPRTRVRSWCAEVFSVRCARIIGIQREGNDHRRARGKPNPKDDEVARGEQSREDASTEILVDRGRGRCRVRLRKDSLVHRKA